MAGDVSVRLRTARPVDARALAEVHVRSWRATYAGTVSSEALAAIDVEQRATLWAHRLEKPPPGRSVLVAELDGVLVGFVLVGPTPDADHDPAGTSQVLSLHVDPLVTGRGVGGLLLAAAVDALTRAGFGLATLWVVSGNKGARRFYERAGWASEGTARREALSVEGETGEAVTVVRYQRRLS